MPKDDPMREEQDAQLPTYKELLGQVAVLTKMLRAYQEGKGEFDKTGILTTTVLSQVPEAAREIVRQNKQMAYALERARQSLYSLIAAEALPSEGWDSGVMQLVRDIENAIRTHNESKYYF
ncbi:hypothetical protein JXA32_11945 [Candidatus Sumerlaeota bacterium]|nr:hypothetical protein [Candidatus Sumerlaeota bacterium]